MDIVISVESECVRDEGKYGVPGRIRTRGPLLRRQPLYPTELQGRIRQRINQFSKRAIDGQANHRGTATPQCLRPSNRQSSRSISAPSLCKFKRHIG